MKKDPARNMDGSLRKVRIYKPMDTSLVLQAVIDHPGNDCPSIVKIIGMPRESTRIRLVRLRDTDLITQVGEGNAVGFYETKYYLENKEKLEEKHSQWKIVSKRRGLNRDKEAQLPVFKMNLLDQIMLRPAR